MSPLLRLAILVYVALGVVVWIITRMVRRDLRPPRRPPSWNRY